MNMDKFVTLKERVIRKMEIDYPKIKEEFDKARELYKDIHIRKNTPKVPIPRKGIYKNTCKKNICCE
jgi:hypothetical protein